MKILSKIKHPNGRREVRLFGKKILSYRERIDKHFCYQQYEKICIALNSCDIYNYEKLKQQGTKFPHLLGIVISRAAKIGNDCIIYQNVTIGARNVEEGDFSLPENYPTIGDGVVIYSGAVIVGPITIGNNAVIGANYVVLDDVPENATVVGVPAKIIKMIHKS